MLHTHDQPGLGRSNAATTRLDSNDDTLSVLMRQSVIESEHEKQRDRDRDREKGRVRVRERE